jgi:hypothetical protein
VSDDGKIIDFNEARKKSADGTTLVVMRSREKTGKYCPHKEVLVGEDFGDVECGTCGVRLDAHAVLLKYAKEERAFGWASQDAQKQLKLHQAEVARLIAEEKRIKARIKRAKETVSADEAKIFVKGMAQKLEDA